jgi:hypothetical protein
LLDVREWSGRLSETYLPHVYAANLPSDVVTRLRADDKSVSTRLHSNFAEFIASLDPNQQTHRHWDRQFNEVQGKQNNAQGIIAGAAVVIGGHFFGSRRATSTP